MQTNNQEASGELLVSNAEIEAGQEVDNMSISDII